MDTSAHELCFHNFSAAGCATHHKTGSDASRENNCTDASLTRQQPETFRGSIQTAQISKTAQYRYGTVIAEHLHQTVHL